MMDNFQKALTFTLKWEGGYVNHPADPGGETNYGISKRSYPNEDIKNLTLARVAEIYKKDYWDAYQLGKVDSPLCVVLFDMFVNMRPTTVMRLRQEAKDSWQSLIQKRKDFYGALCKSNPRMEAFLKGWLNRSNDLSKYCQILEQEQK
jgi:lysozyme family protein